MLNTCILLLLHDIIKAPYILLANKGNYLHMKKTFILKATGIISAFMLPVAFAHAQSGIINYNDSFVQRIVIFLENFLIDIPPILVALAGVVFMFEVVRYIFAGKSGDAKEKDEIRKHMMWSLIALVVLLTFWGIVRMIAGSLALDIGTRNSSIEINQIPSVKL